MCSRNGRDNRIPQLLKGGECWAISLSIDGCRDDFKSDQFGPFSFFFFSHVLFFLAWLSLFIFFFFFFFFNTFIDRARAFIEERIFTFESW